MDKASFDRVWDYFRTVNGVAALASGMLPEDKLDSHPIPGMRTPKQIVIHMYQNVRGLTQSIVDGKLEDEEPKEKAADERIKTKAELLQFCRESWDAAAKTAASITDAQLAGTITTPWGHSWTGAESHRILNDEYWHHRGQLYCFLRALGVAPHSLYDTKNNDPEFAETHA
jgi:uncharacterized damage-inducible protein DinB